MDWAGKVSPLIQQHMFATLYQNYEPRAVVMVGLPYPNLHSPELKEKMSFLNRTVPADADGKQAGQVRHIILASAHRTLFRITPNIGSRRPFF